MLAADGVTTRAASSYGQQVGFTGRYEDKETKLLYFRARYYSGSLGRFIGRDPLGYVEGLSFYQSYFVPNRLDPRGTKCIIEGEGDSRTVPFEGTPNLYKDTIEKYYGQVDIGILVNATTVKGGAQADSQYRDGFWSWLFTGSYYAHYTAHNSWKCEESSSDKDKCQWVDYGGSGTGKGVDKVPWAEASVEGTTSGELLTVKVSGRIGYTATTASATSTVLTSGVSGSGGGIGGSTSVAYGNIITTTAPSGETFGPEYLKKSFKCKCKK